MHSACFNNALCVIIGRPGLEPEFTTLASVMLAADQFRHLDFVIARKSGRFWQVKEKYSITRGVTGLPTPRPDPMAGDTRQSPGLIIGAVSDAALSFS